MTSLLIRGGTVVRPTGDERADILIHEGTIREIYVRTTGPQKLLAADQTIEANGQLLFPGFVDCHVHFREPGMEQKGTMETESQSAVAGGVTTVCDMPNTNPPTVSITALKEKVRIAEGITACDIRFFFGVTQTEHLPELRRLWTEQGLVTLRNRCCGVKLYLDHSTGNQKAAKGVMEEVFHTCAELNIPLVVHCEDPVLNARAAKLNTREDIAAHSAIRAPESEQRAITTAIELAKKTGTHLHIAHLSTKRGVQLIGQAKKDGVAVTCEVAPHHLFLSTEDYETIGTFGKMNPPLRTPDHCEALWEGIEKGVVDCIASDHAPHTPEEKQVTPALAAPSGVPGTETMIPLLLTVAAGRWPHPRRRAFQPKLMYIDIRRLCFDNPNRIFSLGQTMIEQDTSANLVLVQPEEEWELKGAQLHSKCGWTPYEGWHVTGKPTVVGRW
ncbi:MAG: dihydroorotase family protein [Candidatus Peribacteraceae bacterium]|nr:dihydroorotase family protein [Candidatus Peribacteraceae bacterium]MDD5741843.1 dihydroorotase family protein [Candidatus Peribacteraceae bacterium]